MKQPRILIAKVFGTAPERAPSRRLDTWIAQGAEFPTRNAHVMAAATSATRNHLLDAGLNPDEDRGRLHVDNFIMRPYQLRRFPPAIASEDDCE